MIDKKEFQIKLGQKVKAARVSKSLTQRELGIKIGKEQQRINRLESGTISVTAYFLAQVAEALDVSIAELTDFNN